MVYIRAKHRNGRTYYYEQSSHRVDGKVKTKHHRYIGTTIDAKLIKIGTTQEAKEHPEFTKQQQRQIAIDHLKKDKNAYGITTLEKKFNSMYKQDYPSNTINFKSRMVNNENYSYNGSYGLGKEEDNILLNRVSRGDKPVAIFGALNDNNKDKHVEKLHEKALKDKNLIVSPILKKKGRVEFSVSRKGTLKDNFDLKTLKQDYIKQGLPEVAESIERKQNKQLKDYYKDWDAQDEHSKVEYWETGLILGYPIETTIQRTYNKRLKK